MHYHINMMLMTWFSSLLGCNTEGVTSFAVLGSLLRVSLILIPDSSPQAYGVGYSFIGFFGWRDFEGFDLLLPAGRLGGLRSLSVATELLLRVCSCGISLGTGDDFP